MAAVLAAVPADQAMRTWHEAIIRPPLAHYRVLVTLSWGRVVGFVVAGPSNDPDAEVTDGMVAEFVTDAGMPDDHALRLVNVAVDTLRVDGYETTIWWTRNDDDTLRGFLIEYGWAANGVHRGLGTEDGAETIKQAGLATRITDQDPATDVG